MAGRRDDHAGHAGATPGLTGFTRRAALGAGVGFGLLPLAAWAAPAATDVPIRVTFNRPWTAVWLNKQGPFRFQISSGTNIFHVAESLAHQAGLDPIGGDAIGSNRYGRRVSRLFVAKEMVIGDALALGDIRLAVFETETDPVFPGAIPIPSDRVTGFEFGRGLMRYTPELPADVAGYGKVPLRHSDLKLGWMPRVDARLGGKPVRLTISTSSPYSITLYPDAVKRLGLWDGPGPSYDRKGRRAGRDVEIRSVRRGDLELGGLRFQRPVLGLHDPANVLMDRNDADDGEIGMEVLRRVDLIFDPRKDTSWMRPTPAMAEGWSHDRAGFQVFGRDGVWRIVRVDPGSPAARAGLAEGDVLTGMTEEAAMRLAAAQGGAPGTQLQMPIERGGARRQIAVVLEDRL